MNTSDRRRFLVVLAFATCLFLGMALTPPSGDQAAALLASLSSHSTQASFTGAFRLLTSVLTMPALLALGPLVSSRGARLFLAAAVLLHLASFAGVVVFTELLLQNAVLAPMADRGVATTIASANQSTLLWQVAAVLYLGGMLLGFLLLGISLRLAGGSRLWATCVAVGMVVHIAGGDWPWTSITGALVLAVGLVGLGHRSLDGTGQQEARPEAETPGAETAAPLR